MGHGGGPQLRDACGPLRVGLPAGRRVARPVPVTPPVRKACPVAPTRPAARRAVGDGGADGDERADGAVTAVVGPGGVLQREPRPGVPGVGPRSQRLATAELL